MRHRLIGSTKDAIAGALEVSGLIWRRLDRTLSGRVLVLMYHRVLPEQGRDSLSAPGIIVTPETFDLHLAWIRSRLHPLTPGEFGDIQCGRRPPPRRACLVTFDDGWYDNLTYALPALERHEVPAMIFAATGFIGTGDCFWQERLGRMLEAVRQAGPHGLDLLRDAGAEPALDRSGPDARRVIREAVTRLKAMPQPEIEALLHRIERGLGELGLGATTQAGDDRFLSWTELEQLAASRQITIGSHAVSHVPLTRLPEPAREAELHQSRAVLQSRLGREIDWFAYPNGDHDHASAELVRAAGYRGAFTTRDGPATPGRDLFELPRVNMHEASTRTLGRFLSRISGLL